MHSSAILGFSPLLDFSSLFILNNNNKNVAGDGCFDIKKLYETKLSASFYIVNLLAFRKTVMPYVRLGVQFVWYNYLYPQCLPKMLLHFSW